MQHQVHILKLCHQEWHTVFVNSDGTVSTWGAGGYGQLGLNDDNSSKNTPQSVPGLSNVVSVGSAAYGSFAIDKSGKLWAWGDNYAGMYGVGNNTKTNTPIDTGMTNVKAVDGEY